MKWASLRRELHLMLHCGEYRPALERFRWVNFECVFVVFAVLWHWQMILAAKGEAGWPSLSSFHDNLAFLNNLGLLEIFSSLAFLPVLVSPFLVGFFKLYLRGVLLFLVRSVNTITHTHIFQFWKTSPQCFRKGWYLKIKLSIFLVPDNTNQNSEVNWDVGL